ncbi:MAG: tetratricopeptide repeat protein [Planctomycetes bacterium]|nr:tetratricopeptide repeat protein [Planctomycetota bacterium]
MALAVCSCSERRNPQQPAATAGQSRALAPSAATATSAASGPAPAAESPSLPATDTSPVTAGGKAWKVSAGAAPGYVDDKACALCHGQIFETYQSVGMAKSFYPPNPSNIVENFTENRFHHEASGDHFEMTLREGNVYQSRYRIDEAGERYAEFEEQVDWIIGSGLHSRGYFYQSEAGELFQFPLVWYTKDKKWGMAPGYDRADHEGFSRKITRECMFCHNAYPETPKGSDAFWAPQLFPKELPHGIGCQRCHGPGAAHLRTLANPDATMREVRESILDPSKLPPRLRDDVCFQCHLQPTSAQASLIRRYGVADYQYLPGQAIEDYLVHMDFDEGRDRAGRFELNHHPYRLRQSRCYEASEGALNCLTCHDPHVKVAAAARAAHYKSRCLTCHKLEDCDVDAMGARAAGADPDDCVSCHMPARRPEDALEITMTDHLIRRQPAPAEWMAKERARQELRVLDVFPYFPERAPAEPFGSMYKVASALKGRDISWLDGYAQSIAAVKPAEYEPYSNLGVALLRAKRFGEATQVYRQMAERWPQAGSVQQELGNALAASGRIEEGVAALKRAAEMNPLDADNHYWLGLIYKGIGPVQEAVAHFAKAVELRPNYAQAHFNLALLLTTQNELARAITHFQKALGIDPGMIGAYANLGAIYQAQRKWGEAVKTWRRALLSDPRHVEVMKQLANACLLAPDPAVRDTSEGLRYARRAEELAPHDAVAAAMVALALIANRQAASALEKVEAARKLGADEGTCLVLEAIAQHEVGLKADAAATFRAALAAAVQTENVPPFRASIFDAAKKVFGPAP